MTGEVTWHFRRFQFLEILLCIVCLSGLAGALITYAGQGGHLDKANNLSVAPAAHTDLVRFPRHARVDSLRSARNFDGDGESVCVAPVSIPTSPSPLPTYWAVCSVTEDQLCKDVADYPYGACGDWRYPYSAGAVLRTRGMPRLRKAGLVAAVTRSLGAAPPANIVFVDWKDVDPVVNGKRDAMGLIAGGLFMVWVFFVGFFAVIERKLYWRKVDLVVTPPVPKQEMELPR